MPKPEQPIVKRKYPNRRLYNTGTSTYMTLEHLADMVRQGEDLVASDAKSSKDITRRPHADHLHADRPHHR